MAFTGTAVITQVSDRIVRITGLSLLGGASGTIGLNGATGSAPDVRLPATFQPSPATYAGHAVSLSDQIDVTQQQAQANLAVAIAVPIVKTGTTVADWRATITNQFGSASDGMEIYVKLHD